MTSDFLSAENAVAGAILIDPACIPVALSLLTPEDFATESNRAIFAAARDLDRSGKCVDAVTIERQIGGIVPRNYLMSLMDTTPTAANVEAYAAIVREAAQRRALRALGESICQRVKDAENASEIIGDTTRMLEALEARDTGDIMSSKDSVFGFYDYRNRIEKSGGIAVPTGFAGLDRMLGGGMLNTGLYLIAARPGVGKTTLALSLADSIAENVGPVLFVSLEMSGEQLTAKRISRCTNISSSVLLTKPKLSAEDYKTITDAGDYLSGLPLDINRRPRCTVSDVRALARKVKGLRLVVVDYLGLLLPEGKTQNRYEAITRISGDLKALARTLDVPVLALCQLNRANEGRGDKKPALSDLRDSGSLEQDADGVILLHRDDYYDDDPSQAAPIELHLAKNRHAGVGTVQLCFKKATSSFVEIRGGV